METIYPKRVSTRQNDDADSLRIASPSTSNVLSLSSLRLVFVGTSLHKY